MEIRSSIQYTNFFFRYSHTLQNSYHTTLTVVILIAEVTFLIQVTYVKLERNAIKILYKINIKEYQKTVLALKNIQFVNQYQSSLSISLQLHKSPEYQVRLLSLHYILNHLQYTTSYCFGHILSIFNENNYTCQLSVNTINKRKKIHDTASVLP